MPQAPRKKKERRNRSARVEKNSLTEKLLGGLRHLPVSVLDGLVNAIAILPKLLDILEPDGTGVEDLVEALELLPLAGVEFDEGDSLAAVVFHALSIVYWSWELKPTGRFLGIFLVVVSGCRIRSYGAPHRALPL